VLMRYTHG
jgi:DNA-binding transcriptional LysR family regulator